MELSSRKSERSALISSSTSLQSSSYLDSNKKTLLKSVGYPQLFAYVVGILIGSGVYISPSLVAKYSNNMGIALIIWILSGIIALFGALCFCELAMLLKKTGAYYIYIKETYGDLAGFITVWTTVIIITPAGMAVVSVAIGEHVVGAYTEITSPNGVWMTKGIAVFCLLVSCLINIISTSFTNKTQSLFAFLQILSMTFFISIGVWKASTGGIQNYSAAFATNGSVEFQSLSVTFYSALWSYDGWGVMPSVTEELTNAQRDLWLALVTGIPFVITCYVLINLAFLSVLSYAEIAASPIVASEFVEKSLGSNFSFIVPIIVAANCFGCLNATIFFTSRNMLSAAREGQLPEPICYIHKHRRTPFIALFVSFLLSSAWTLSLGSGTGTLVTYFSFAVWIVYGLALAAVLVLRVKQPDLPRPFKVWIANPVFMCLVSAYLILAPFFKFPVECAICLATLLLSIPVYFMIVQDRACIPPSLKRFKEAVYNSILRRFDLAVCVFVEEHKEGPSENTEVQATTSTA